MSRLVLELRHVARKLARTPGFTAVTALTLALGIGATTAIFTVVNGVLLRPLPYRDADRLVGLWHAAPGVGQQQFEQSEGTYLLYRAENRSFGRLLLENGLQRPDGIEADLGAAIGRLRQAR